MTVSSSDFLKLKSFSNTTPYTSPTKSFSSPVCPYVPEKYRVLDATSSRYNPYPRHPSPDTVKKKLEFSFITTVEKAFDKYKKNLYFHGTSRHSAKLITRNGFKKNKKTEGCADIFIKQFGIEDVAAKKYHYLMGLKSAARYAKMYDDPRILRVIVPHAIRLEKDPEGYDDDEMRTSDDIESHFILPKSKKELTVEQLSEINLSLDIKLSKTNNRCLRKLIYKKIIKPRKKDSSLIADSLDFKKEQQAVIDTELKKISQSIDLSRLKEGDTISLSLD